ncbi:MAG: FkbM family methyltransferase [Elusimicrobiota bacterium]|jgi:FkbM family methyltransferase|nr:FkbM family methyltransferase [Elusimicrobiota bacterium]
MGGGRIFPVKKGLGSTDGELEMFISINHSSPLGNTIVKNMSISSGEVEKIQITSLDNFANKQNLKRVDFIKSDIEGAERDMLKGARNVLKEFAPKLALSTYHLPDDPEVMEALIKDANPSYKVVHLNKKLFAACKRK